MVRYLFAIRKTVLIVGLVCLLGSPSLFAEGNTRAHCISNKVVVQIDDLSNTERDMIIRKLAKDPKLSIDFMCVPAGIMVISYELDARKELMNIISGSLSKRGTQRVHELKEEGQDYAEQACADIRNTQIVSDEK